MSHAIAASVVNWELSGPVAAENERLVQAQAHAGPGRLQTRHCPLGAGAALAAVAPALALAQRPVPHFALPAAALEVPAAALGVALPAPRGPPRLPGFVLFP